MTRPIAPAPIVANIPPELQARPQWVVWRYEERQRRDGSTYWTKVPYVPGETRKARSNRPSTWRSFNAAVAAYEQNPIGLDGIGYMFSKADPYIGGDQDHNLSTDIIPLTYAEISPSGQGIKFIARATGDYGRHTVRGELYSHGRFFTITGRILDQQHAQIADQQEAVERFNAALGNGRTSRNGGTASGSRATQAAAIERATWDEANELWRIQRDRLVRREQAAAGKEDTQFAVLLRGDYAEYHRRWPGRNLYRADGSLDDSQVRFWHGCCLYGRGFTLAEYIALMHIHFGKDAIAKWGNMDLWKQELAAMWAKYPDYTAYTPRQPLAQTPEPTYTVPATPRGRAGDHAALVERVYQLLQDHRAGAEAIVKCGELARAINVHRRTIVTILNELRDSGRVVTRTIARHGGLIVSFLGVIVDAVPPPDQLGTACNLGVIYSPAAEPVSPMPTPQTDVLDGAAPEETIHQCVSSSSREADHSSPMLRDLAAYYLDQPAPEIGQRCVSKRTGQITYRRTAQHFASLVSTDYGDVYTTEQALDAYAAEQQHRKELAAAEWRRFFARLKAMTNDELIAYIAGGCRREVHELAREGTPFDKHQYRTRLKCAKQHLGWRGLTMPARKGTIDNAQVDRVRARDHSGTSGRRAVARATVQSVATARQADQGREHAGGGRVQQSAFDHEATTSAALTFDQPVSEPDSGTAQRASLLKSLRDRKRSAGGDHVST